MSPETHASTLQVSGNTLQQVEKFNFIGGGIYKWQKAEQFSSVQFIYASRPSTEYFIRNTGTGSDGRSCHLRHCPHNEIDTRVGKADAVLREFYRSVVTKRELSNTTKPSLFKSIFVPILTYGHESWVMTEIILTQVQAPKMGFLQRVHGMTKGHTEVRLRPGQETNLAPPYLNLSYFGSKCTALKK